MVTYECQLVPAKTYCTAFFTPSIVYQLVTLIHNINLFAIGYYCINYLLKNAPECFAWKGEYKTRNLNLMICHAH